MFAVGSWSISVNWAAQLRTDHSFLHLLQQLVLWRVKWGRESIPAFIGREVRYTLAGLQSIVGLGNDNLPEKYLPGQPKHLGGFYMVMDKSATLTQSSSEDHKAEIDHNKIALIGRRTIPLNTDIYFFPPSVSVQKHPIMKSIWHVTRLPQEVRLATDYRKHGM